MKLELWYPVDSIDISQKFGPENTFPDLLPKYKSFGLLGHNGWDFTVPKSAVVRASHDGIITYAGLDGANGNIMVIRTDAQYDYGEKQSYFKTVYGHLLSFVAQVNTNVKVGDIIALADNTGWSTGDHLHFGLKPIYSGEQDWQWFNLEPFNGYNGAIDPSPYFNGFLAKNKVAVIENLTEQINLYQKVVILIKQLLHI